MPDPDARLPGDPFVSEWPAVDSFLHGLQLADTLAEAKATSPEQYARVFSGFKLSDFAALADAIVILRANGQAVDEQRRRRWRPWRWRRRWPPWR